MSDTIFVQRCPAEDPIVADRRIQGWRRCELPIGHSEAHQVGDKRWRFTEGSWSGLPEDHPDYVEFIEVPRDRAVTS